MEYSSSVEEYVESHDVWGKELRALREIVLSTGLDETVKWGAPVYTHGGKNVVGLGAFKAYVGIWFYQGVFLKDEKNKLINAQENKTKALRQWRFASYDEIVSDVETIKAYVAEAVENEKQGKAIKPDREKPLVIPPELKAVLAATPDLREGFESLSKSKRREYAEYIAEAKRDETKQKRLDKIIPMISDGVGLNDRYK